MLRSTEGAARSGRALWVSLGLRLVVVVAAVMSLVAVGAYFNVSRHQRTLLVGAKVTTGERLLGLFTASVAPAVVFSDLETMNSDVTDLMRDPDVIGVQIWAREETGLATKPLLNRHRSSGSVVTLVPEREHGLVVEADHVELVRPISGPDQATVAVVRATFSLARENAAIAATNRRILAISILAALGTIVVLVLAIGRSLLQPMRELRMARELEIAAKIQRALVPTRPRHPDFEIAGRMIPADEVGGDFFDVLTDGGRLWITIGDVSGHGLPAGLIMLMTQSAFATEFRAENAAARHGTSDVDPNAMLTITNQLLCEYVKERLDENKYATCQLFVYQGQGAFDVAGGHLFPLVLRKATGSLERVEVEGAWLGIIEPFPTRPTQRVKLDPGDVLCLFTDGAIEAQAKEGELYDVARFTESLRQALLAEASLEAAIDRVMRDLLEFCPNPSDDVSILLLRRTEGRDSERA